MCEPAACCRGLPGLSLTSVFSILYLVISGAMLLRILARPDLNSPTRIAWVLVLFVLPFVGAAAYLLFGEVYFGSGSWRRYDAALRATSAAARQSGSALNDRRWGPASAFMARIDGFGMTEGNRGELFATPEDARSSLIRDIDAAKTSVHLVYYIWLNDRTGVATAQALMRAAGRGVKCRVMIDAVGSHQLSRSQLWRDLASAGVETQIALPIGNPFSTILSRRLDLRNHRKISVIDGRIGYCGSQNCADPEFLPKRRFAPWVDIMVRFEGPVVSQMLLTFAQDWLMRRPDTPVSDFPLDAPKFMPGFPAQAVATGPAIRRGVADQLFASLIYQARRELVITTPYLVPGDVVSSALCGAARSGVAVTLIVPHRNDSPFVAAASRSYYPQLVAAGVTIAEFRGGLLHSKTITIDGETTFMGSSNIDVRSFDLNFENDVLFVDRELTRAVRQRQQDYLDASMLVSAQQVRAWPIWKRIWFNAFATVGPLL